MRTNAAMKNLAKFLFIGECLLAGLVTFYHPLAYSIHDHAAETKTFICHALKAATPGPARDTGIGHGRSRHADDISPINDLPLQLVIAESSLDYRVRNGAKGARSP